MDTRRAFLQRMAAACLAGPQIVDLERSGPAQRVVILGAGLAGLCAAYELRRQGHAVTLLEAQLRPGGRVQTLRAGLAPGLYVELGPETIPQAHDITMHYVRTLGLRLAPVATPGTRSFLHVRGQRILPDAKPSQDLASLRQKYLEPALRDAQAAGFPDRTIRALAALDHHTPGSWLLSQGASYSAAELLTLGFGLNLGSAASFLLHRLNSMGPAGAWHVDGGNDQLPRAFAKAIDIRYGAHVVDVAQDDDGVTVSIRTPAGVETLRADRAVCTLPCPTIGTILRQARLSDAKQRAIAQQSYARASKVFLQTRTRFWLQEGLDGNVTTDLPIERLTPAPVTADTERGALAAYPIGTYAGVLEQMREQERVAEAFAQARKIFPTLGQYFEGGVSKCWGLDRWQRGSFALHTPGQLGFIDILAQSEGRIHFAGEHTSLWTGWMQGALESARRVVREINSPNRTA